MATFFERGRIRELESLQEQYDQNKFAFIVVYGRRRVGKSSIINEFIERGSKKAIRFVATEDTNMVNLEKFSRNIFSVFPNLSSIGTFPSWESAFDYIAEQAKKEKLIVFIDEYPYIAKAYPPISSELQKYIDTVLQKTDMMLILCGSSMSFMENQVLGYESPLYGRRTAQYRIAPLDYYDSSEFFGSASTEDKLIGYAVTGGIPQYLSVISEAATVEAGIERSFFTKNGFMYEEPQNLLKQELREPAVYKAIITAIANGATRPNEISSKIHEEERKTSVYIKNLIDLGILERVAPMFASSSRSSIFRLKDGMYRFWYRFVPDATEMIEAGYRDIYKEDVKPFINDFMGSAFEDICMQYLTRLNIGRRLPFRFGHIGRWRGGNPITKKDTEIDAVAASADEKKLILCECKWRNREPGQKTYDALKEKAALFPGKEIYYYIFSGSGFEAGLKKEAGTDKRLTLIGTDDLFNI